MSKIIKTLRRHPLISLLINSKGNPKVLLLMEPLWGIPNGLIAPFATLYMYTQGVDDVQIGLILTISMVAQVFFSFAGGIMTDKFGRKNTLMLGDFFGWVVACAIWAASGNFWMFLVAALFNCFEMVNQTAWHCHMVEDADEKDIPGIYSWVYIAGLISVFVAPISGLLISKFTLVPVVRVLYIIFSVNMLVKGFITYFFTKETKRGAIRKEQTKNIPVRQMIAEYKNVVPLIFKNKETLRMMVLNVIIHITVLVNGSFFSLYASTKLGVSEQDLAIFPILRAAVMLLFMFGIQHKLERVRSNVPLWAGLGIFVLCQLMLIIIPAGMILPIMIFIILEAVASALVYPRKDAMLMLVIDAKERARITALMTSFTIAFSSPFGYLAGYISSIDRRLPFVFTCGLYLLAIVIVGRMRERKEQEA